MHAGARLCSVAAGLALAAAVAFSAWHAHGLSARLAPAELAVFERALHQHYWAGAGLWVAALLLRSRAGAAARLGAAALGLGALLFCGALYWKALGGPEAVSQAAPWGGALQIAGWLLLGLGGACGGERRREEA